MAAKHRMAGTARPRRLAATLLAIAAVAITCVIAGTLGSDGSYAAWSSTAVIPGAALRTGNAHLSVTSAQSLTHTFSSSSTSAVGSVTIKNTGTTTLRGFFPSVSLSGSTALAQNISVQIWPLTSGTSCGTTAPNGTPSYAWNAVPTTWLSGQAALGANTSASYCLLSTANTTALITDASQHFTPTISITGRTDATSSTGWSTGAQTAPASTLSTAAAPSWSIVGNQGTAVTTTVTPWQSTGYCFDVKITATSYFVVTWQLTVDASLVPFSTHTVADQWTWPNGQNATSSYSSRHTQITLTGDNAGWFGWGGDTTVSPGNPVELYFCIGGN